MIVGRLDIYPVILASLVFCKDVKMSLKGIDKGEKDDV